MKIIATPRLNIRKITNDDIDNLSLVLCDPVVMQYSTVGVHTRRQVQTYIDNCIEQYRSCDYGHWAIYHNETNDFIGICGLNRHTVEDNELLHINYRLNPQHQGQGFATEASQGVIEYTKNILAMSNIAALIDPNNQSSLKVVERLGFKFIKKTLFIGFTVDIYQLSF